MINLSYIFICLVIINTIFSQSYRLEECVIIALENKKTVLSANLEVQSGEKGLKVAFSNFLPNISFSSTSSRINFPEQRSIIPNLTEFSLDTLYNDFYDNISTGLALNQTIYDGNRNLNQYRQAKLNLEIAKLNERITKTRVIQNVISSYYNLLQAYELLEVAKKNKDMSEQQIGLVKKQFDLGVVKKSDLLKARVALGQAQVDLLNKSTALRNARRVLFNDMGLEDFGQQILPKEDEWITKELPSKGDLLKKLKEINPNLLLSKKQIEITNIRYNLIRGFRLPSVNSSLNYSANSEDFRGLSGAIKEDWSFGLNISVSLPIYTGKSLLMQQQQAKISINQSEYNHLNLLNDLQVQAEQVKESLENFTEIIPINESVVISAKEDLKLVRERYSLGSATILEVLDAQVSLFRSNSTLINSIHGARILEANLKAILGSLDLEYKNKDK